MRKKIKPPALPYHVIIGTVPGGGWASDKMASLLYDFPTAKTREGMTMWMRHNEQIMLNDVKEILPVQNIHYGIDPVNNIFVAQFMVQRLPGKSEEQALCSYLSGVKADYLKFLDQLDKGYRRLHNCILDGIDTDVYNIWGEVREMDWKIKLEGKADDKFIRGSIMLVPEGFQYAFNVRKDGLTFPGVKNETLDDPDNVTDAINSYKEQKGYLNAFASCYAPAADGSGYVNEDEAEIVITTPFDKFADIYEMADDIDRMKNDLKKAEAKGADDDFVKVVDGMQTVSAIDMDH